MNFAIGFRKALFMVAPFWLALCLALLWFAR